MRRRDFITLLGGAAMWPLAARAQQSTLPVIGFLGSGTPDLFADRLRGFRQGLSEIGFMEGQNVAIEYRWAESRNDQLPALAADLVRRRVNVVVAGGYPAALAAKAASTTIPIVFQVGDDPARTGLVASVNRPGKNVTGVNSMNGELGPKQLELVREFVPASTSFAFLRDPTNPGFDAPAITKARQETAGALGLQVRVVAASSEREFESVFADLVRSQVGGLVIAADPFLQSRSERLGSLAFRHRLPAIAQLREFVAAGGLMGYGASISDQLRQVGVYAGRILKGENPADLPVQQPTKFELIINLKTANTLGLSVPPSLLAVADEVIE